VGLNAAKALAVTYDKPFIGVNHLNAHVCANYIDTNLEPPLIALLVSGGHTQINKVDSYLQQEIIGETNDDATGEAYDKVARLLGLPYPGGLNLDKMSPNGNPHAYKLPDAKVQGEFDFSFSGLKTAVLNLVRKLERDGEVPKEDVAASFQECITSTLFKKTLKAAEHYGIKQIALGGGVAANSEIRKKFFALEEKGYKIFAPAMKYCTDNASMIASSAYFLANTMDSLEVEVFSRC
jgi:N6-L-threonylcarbamoyladenine synthase